MGKINYDIPESILNLETKIQEIRKELTENYIRKEESIILDCLEEFLKRKPTIDDFKKCHKIQHINDVSLFVYEIYYENKPIVEIKNEITITNQSIHQYINYVKFL